MDPVKMAMLMDFIWWVGVPVVLVGTAQIIYWFVYGRHPGRYTEAE